MPSFACFCSVFARPHLLSRCISRNAYVLPRSKLVSPAISVGYLDKIKATGLTCESLTLLKTAYATSSHGKGALLNSWTAYMCDCECGLKARRPEGVTVKSLREWINNLCLQSLPLCCLSLPQFRHDSGRRAFYSSIFHASCFHLWKGCSLSFLLSFFP